MNGFVVGGGDGDTHTHTHRSVYHRPHHLANNVRRANPLLDQVECERVSGSGGHICPTGWAKLLTQILIPTEGVTNAVLLLPVVNELLVRCQLFLLDKQKRIQLFYSFKNIKKLDP